MLIILIFTILTLMPSSNAETAPSNIHKAVLTQRGVIQFLKYRVDVPPLSQFTFCVWLKSYNLTHSHPILSYSQHQRDRLLRVWLSPGGKWLRAKLLEQDISATRVNIRENIWVHICHSWHSLTSKWQLYLDGHLRAQGTAEKLRDIVVPGGGDIVLGQEYTDFNKGLDDGIEGELFGFNMVLSSTTEAGNHRYLHRQESRDHFQTLSPNGDIHDDYVRLADLEDHINTRINRPKPEEHDDQVLDIEQLADAPIQISQAPPVRSFNEPGSVLKPPSTFSSQWQAYLPPPTPQEPTGLTYESEYSKINFKGNEWYDQNRYFPKDLLKPKQKYRNHHKKGRKNQTQKEISLLETSELYPYPSENEFVYAKDIPGVPIERSHTVFKRDLIQGDKNIRILNPESVIVYPRKSDVVNVELYPRKNPHDEERTTVVIALRPEDNESQAEETKLIPRPFSLSNIETDNFRGDASKPSFEVLYAQTHYMRPNNTPDLSDNGPYTVDIGGSQSEDLPRQIPVPQPHFVYYGNPYNLVYKKYPQSISDKINDEEVEHSQFRKAVKLGNALNELQIFKQHGNNRDNSFVNSDNRVPDIVRYRSDIDSLEGERRYHPKEVISSGRKLVELSYRKCLLAGGAPLSSDSLSLVTWTQTPVKMFGGAIIKPANPSCGLF